jgi:uncharacterized membrane protein YebE (DUF533 family)
VFDADRILGQLLGSSAAAGFAGGLAGGMLTTKGGRKLGKSALKYGGIAAVGALAYAAFKRHQQSKGIAPSPPPALADRTAEFVPPPLASGFVPASDSLQAVNDLGLLLLRAMIAAARADGRLDGDEMKRVLDRADALELGSEDKSRLLDELRAPVDLDRVVEGADTPEKRAEVYAASLLAIDVDTDAERGYLAMLRARLGIEPDLAEQIEREIARAS